MANINRWQYHHGGQSGRDALREELENAEMIAKLRMLNTLRNLLDLVGEKTYDAWVDAALLDTDTPGQIEEKARAEIKRVVAHVLTYP